MPKYPGVCLIRGWPLVVPRPTSSLHMDSMRPLTGEYDKFPSILTQTNLEPWAQETGERTLAEKARHFTQAPRGPWWELATGNLQCALTPKLFMWRASGARRVGSRGRASLIERVASDVCHVDSCSFITYNTHQHVHYSQGVGFIV